MHYINADGTLAQMCGNGVRCFSKFLVDKNIVSHESHLVADTMAGLRPITFDRDATGKMACATVEMGHPILEPAQVPVALQANAKTSDGQSYAREIALASPWGEFRFTCVSMGNPHAVCFIQDWDALGDEAFTEATHKSLQSLDVAKVGAFFESHEIFPEKSNIEFAEITPEGIAMRVYERGCAETLACGTGACAVNVAAVLTQAAPRRNDVHLLGGILHINWREDGMVEMSGPATESFSGTVDVDAYAD